MLASVPVEVVPLLVALAAAADQPRSRFIADLITTHPRIINALENKS